MKKSTGFADVLIGLQYGDEGKAKVIDLIADNYDIIARFNGGANAGHTIETTMGKIGLHQIPSGIFYKNKLLYIGSGCVVDMVKLVAEIKQVQQLGIDLSGRLILSDQASIVQPHHILVDELTAGEIGTTKNGIGPAYADKAMRMVNERLVNIKLADLIDNVGLFAQIQINLERKIQKHNVKGYDVAKIMQRLKEALLIITPFVTRDTLFLQKKVEGGERVLFEGAQSVMLDITKGFAPYVTSSNTVAGAAFVGGDISPKYHRKTIGVAKAIMSRVGNGPFISEFGKQQSEEYCMNGVEHNKDYELSTYNVDNLLKSSDSFDLGIALRIMGNEYGTTTKRPRRIGMLDLVQLSYAVTMNGVDELFLNKCDLLIDFARTNKKTIPLVTGYTLEGRPIDYVPASHALYTQVIPVIEELPGFSISITHITSAAKLPKALKTFLTKVQQMTHCKIMGIGTGSSREAYILL